MLDIICKKFNHIEKVKRKLDIKYLNKKIISKEEREILNKYDNEYLEELLKIEDMIIYAKLQISEDDVFAECHKLLADINDKATVNRQLGIKMDGIAYAWIFDNDSRFWWHNGGTDNYNCYLGFSIERQKAVIVLSNLPPSYKIPATALEGKKQIRVKFVAKPHRQVGELYEVRLVK